MKKAITKPIPKVLAPTTCSDFRPISLTPILSRLFDKAVVRILLYPVFTNPLCSILFSDQFAFRPTGSTVAALISILHHATSLLSTNHYVRIIALDFSKAFDTVRHSTILSKLASLPVDDIFYNWCVNYFSNHSHVTNFNGQTSSMSADITASVFQGSAMGPPMYVVNGIDLKPLCKGNLLISTQMILI
jgi:hypothetical protein